jgi:hypothetical protein
LLDDPRINPFQRIVGIWFDDSEGWREDFVGVFILDRPDFDHLQQWRGYITTR